MVAPARFRRSRNLDDLRIVPILLVTAALGSVLAFFNIASARQVIGFALVPLFIKIFFTWRVPLRMRQNGNPSLGKLSIVGALVTLLYGIRSYVGSPIRLALLAALLIWLASRLFRSGWRDVIALPGVLVVVGEIVAGAGYVQDVVSGICTVVIWLFLLAPLTSRQALAVLRNSLIIAQSLILLAFAAGVSRPYTRVYRFDFDSVESRGGLTSFRWYLPLSAGWEPPAVLALTLGLLSLTLLMVEKKQRLLSVLGLCIGFITVFGVNGRTAELVFLGGLVVVPAVYFFRAARIPALIIATSLMCLPLIHPSLMSVSRQLSSAAVRSGLAVDSQRFVTIEGRSVIWSTSLRVFAESPIRRKVLGYGEQGFIASGAADLYSSQFGRSGTTGGYAVGYYDAHSLLLVVLLSQGLLGLGIVLACWVHVARKVLKEETDVAWAAPLIGLWTFGGMSSTSTACLPSNATYGIIAVVLMLLPFAQRRFPLVQVFRTRLDGSVNRYTAIRESKERRST